MLRFIDRANIFGSSGAHSNTLTPFYPFPVENERRVPCSFIISSHLARFLSLLVCLLPRAWKNVLSLSHCLCFSLKHLHTNMCEHSNMYVGVMPKSLAFAYINKTVNFPYCCTCHFQASSFSSRRHLSPSWTEWSDMQNDWTDQKRRHVVAKHGSMTSDL